ncbi:uncharacterized protein [Globicephala melas]|uniref:uncharacterized protein isoform X5 n=1 Tax=Globicephala melas TaxID=9731 RepID=UPI00293D6864|nr:uncharacterized protein LOC132597970 isoform X2 [Globicephala melas]
MSPSARVHCVPALCRTRRLQVSASGATESTHPGQGGRSGRDPAGVPGEAFQRKRSCRLTCKVVTAARPCAAAFVKICSSHPLSRGTVQFMATPLLANYSYFCQPVDDSQSLFILRKKPEQLTFLHVYLHGPVLLNGKLMMMMKVMMAMVTTEPPLTEALLDRTYFLGG